MKRLFVLLTSVISTVAIAQETPSWIWASYGGGSGADFGRDVAVGSSGRIYSLAFLTSGAIIDGETISVAGTNDLFLICYEPDGDLQWVSRIDEKDQERSGERRLVLDSEENIYIAGRFTDVLTFYHQDGTTAGTETAGGGLDFYLAKYDMNGRYIWSTGSNSPGDDDAYALSLDAEDNIYLAGLFNQTLTLGASTISNVPGDDDVFLVKYDNDGNFLWLRQIGSDKRVRCWDLAVNSENIVFVVGEARGNVSFQLNEFSGLENTSGELKDTGFIFKYSDGNYVDHVFLGDDKQQRIYGVAIDQNDNYFLTGSFTGGPLLSTSKQSAGSSDIFIAKYDRNDNFQWAERDGDYCEDRGQAIALDPSGNAYVTGYRFKSGDCSSLNYELDNGDVYVGKFDQNGVKQWEKSLGGDNWDYGHRIAVDPAGNVHVTGIYQNSVSFDDGNIDALPSSAGGSYFLAKIGIAPDNQPPTADAGDDQEVSDQDNNGEANVTLDGSGSSDPEGQPLSYAWTWNGGSVSGVNPTVTLPVGQTTITLTVTDDKGETGTDEVVITVIELIKPDFTLSTSVVEEDEDFIGTRTVSINPANNTPTANYSFSPELSSISFANVSYDAASKQITITSKVNTSGSVSIVVTAQDQNNSTNIEQKTLDIIINPVNDPPTVVNPVANVFVLQDTEPRVIDISNVFSDVDDANLTYTVESNNSSLVNAELSGTSLTLNFTAGQVGKADIKITATDNEGESVSDEFEVTIQLAGTNLPPTANAGTDQVVTDEDKNGMEEVALDGSASDDPDGDIVSYKWSENDVLLPGGDVAQPTVTLDVGEHTIVLTVTDNDEETSSDTVVITIIQPGNELPIADAGDDIRREDTDKNGEEVIVLNGSGSRDPDGTIESYSWRENNIEIATGITPTVTLEVGVHTIILTVTDNVGARGTDQITVEVVDAGNTGPLGEDNVNPSVQPPSFPAFFEISGSQDLSPEVVATDDRGINILTSTFRYAGIMQDFETEARTLEVILSDVNTYSVLLSPSDLRALDPLGIQYQFTVQDTSGNAASSIVGKTYWKYDLAMPTQKSLMAQPKKENYQIIAVPFNQQPVNSAWPGLNYDKKNIRLFRHNPFKAPGNSYEEYDSLFSDFEPGRGYWLLAKPGVLSKVQGEVVPPNSDGTISIEVEAGWNLIGNPFPFAIRWDVVRNYQDNQNLLQNSGIIKVFRTSDYSTNDVTEIEAYEGFFVNISRAGTLLIPMHASTNGRLETESTKLVSLDEADWRISLTVDTPDSSRQQLGLGMHPKATLQRDYYDADVFPGFFSNTGIALQREGFQFSADIIPTASFAEWSIHVPGDEKAEWFLLEWDNQLMQGSKQQLWLFNPSSLQTIDMKEKSSYRFQMTTDIQHLKILYGAKAELLGYLAPEQLTIGKVYPNPASQVIRIPLVVPEKSDRTIQLRMLDMMGKVVLNNSHPVSLGIHEISTEVNVKSGVYYLQILSEEDEMLDIQKVVMKP